MLHHAFGRFYQTAFAETGLTYAKYVMLKALVEKGKMSLSELSARLGVEPNTVSPLAKKMAGVGTVDQRVGSVEVVPGADLRSVGQAVGERQ